MPRKSISSLFANNGRKDPRRPWTIALSALAAANLIAAYFVYNPPGGSAESLEGQIIQTRTLVQREQADVMRLRGLVKKVESARAEQEKFMNKYFVDRGEAASVIQAELVDTVAKSGLKAQAQTFQAEPVEGSDSLTMLTITGSYEGAYGDLVKFVNLLDRSGKFLMIDTVSAAPQQQSGQLLARFKINTFIRGTQQ